MKKIGEVTHYFGKPEVAVLKLSDKLEKGDTVKFMRGDEELFEQKVKSLEIDHEKVEEAGKGDDVAMKVDEKLHEGNEVYLEE
ncbi:MAG TPA: U32 family peptidase C-terminal domain-containing protein [Candidatus Paceibacterota bacterium]|nr:U32 family peptidase C-terminal domain-containing protein [Candidatus Paceibacterota bacterium]